jgi:SAM-dependent methyltransferase
MKDRLEAMYRRRFESAYAGRREVWRTLIGGWFSRYLDGVESVLDLGCGWGLFINQVDVANRFAIDANPDARARLDPAVELVSQEAAQRWPLPDASLDLVFTSNFLEHLPDRDAISTALGEARRCLRPHGRVVCLGPNIRYMPGHYWDYFDHLIPLTDRSLAEAVEVSGFRVEEQIPRFLPWTMTGKSAPPAFAIRAYLRLRPLWPLIGRQFLVVASKPR